MTIHEDLSKKDKTGSSVAGRQGEQVEPQKKTKGGQRFLGVIERVGNKLPDPFVLFVILALIVILLSALGNALGGSVEHPATGEEAPIKSLLSGEGVVFIVTSMLDNFTGFAPLGLVLAIMLGIGLTEQVGYLGYAIKKSVQRLPLAVLPFAAVFVGIMGNLASDAAMVVIPPLTAIVFYKAGRHPIAGIAAGFAGAGIGFTANLLVAGTDALLAGISTEAARIVDPTFTVTPVANWYFNIVCVLVLTVVGGLITTKVIEPRLGAYEGDALEDEEDEYVPNQDRALLIASLLGLAYAALIAVAVIVPSSPLRGEGGSIVNSPFLDGIIPLILGLFMVVGISYGIVVGKIKNTRDLSTHMTEGIAGMAGYIVMVFAIAQFIQYFNWTNLGIWLAVNGSEFLKGIGFTGILLIVSYSVFTSLLNFLIPSGSAKWALEAPIFMPMFMQLGYHPGFIQAAYRIGDSSTNMITPISPYLPILLGYIRRYDKEAGVGTYITLMLPYTLAFFGAFVAVLLLFVFTGMPFGPGVGVYL